MKLEEIKQRHRQAVDNLATMPLVPYEAGEVVRRFVNLDCLELIAELERLRNANDASEAHANEWIDKLDSDIRRLKGLVRDAYMEGLDAGHNTTINVSAGYLWADSEARAELGDD